MNEIVVGVDGSEPARRALAFAAHEAALRGARLRVVYAWELPATVYSAGIPLPEEALNSFQSAADDTVREAIAVARRQEPQLDCSGGAFEGQAARILIEQAQDAALLVVGSRGHGGFASLLLGSVSQQVAHHPLPGRHRPASRRARRDGESTRVVPRTASPA